MPNYNGVWSLSTHYQYRTGWPTTLLGTPIGVFTSGHNSNVLDFVDINTTGNATDFGDATAVKYNTQGHGNNTRGITGYGGTNATTTIDFISMASKGNAADFGDTATAFGAHRGGGCGNNTRGVFGGATANNSNIIEYVTMANLGNGTDFGNLSLARARLTATSSATRGVFAGGYTASANFVDTIDYIAIGTTGNASDFGNLTSSGRSFAAAFASATRGVFAGGYKDGVGSQYTNIVDYITIGSTGNATDFGDLSANRSSAAGTSSATRGIIGGGDEGSAVVTIDYFTIGSTGNATDFGDLTVVKRWGDAVGSGTAAGAA
tara:strand:- start:36 stop:995 length:960 start_codon:yes stop_codon:yes gene_type:complete